MLIARSGTVAEQISIYFYHISFLKLQIQQDVLSGPSSGEETRNTASTLHQEKLEAWYGEWNRALADRNDQGLDTALLAAWGQFQYYEAAVFLSRNDSGLPEDDTSSDAQRVHHCDSFVQACTTLSRGHRTAPLNPRETMQFPSPYFFPMVWTIAHGIFAAAIMLLKGPQSSETVQEARGRNSALRRCLTLMASLEASPENMASGFSEVLERLCVFDEEQ